MLDDTPPFYDGIKSRAFAISPSLVEDESLFQTILLALAGRRKHVLVRTAEENVLSVLKLSVNVSPPHICTSVTSPIFVVPYGWESEDALCHSWL